MFENFYLTTHLEYLLIMLASQKKCFCVNLNEKCFYCQSFEHIKKIASIERYSVWDLVSHTHLTFDSIFFARLVFSELSGYHLIWERMDSITENELNIYYERFYQNNKKLDYDFEFLFYSVGFINFTREKFCKDCNYGPRFLLLLNDKDIVPKSQQDLDKEIYLISYERQLRKKFVISLKMEDKTDELMSEFNPIVYAPQLKWTIEQYIQYIDRNGNDQIEGIDENLENEQIQEQQLNESGFEDND